MKLKHILSITSLAVCLAICSVANAQTRHKVVSLVKQQQTNEWYAEQAKLWGDYLKSHQKDADAWLNYYTANRMLKIQAQTKTQEDLDELLVEMKKAIPNAFEYHYICYWNDGFRKSEENFPHLQKAYEIAPNRPETYDDFFSYYLVRNDQTKLKELAEKWMKSNDISAGIYAWNYNMLMSCEPNAILITHGDNDTYPALILQLAKNIRPDIVVMNNSLMLVDGYRNAHFAKAGIAPLELDFSTFKSYEELDSTLYGHIIKNRGERPLYFGLGFNPEKLPLLNDKVYNVGMAHKYCEVKFDNIAVIKKNFEKYFLLDYLKHSFTNDISHGVVTYMSANYLAAMLTLYNHYIESEDPKAEELKGLINKIAEANNVQDQVKDVLNEK